VSALLVRCAQCKRFPALHNSPHLAIYDISVSEVPIPQLSTILEPDYGARGGTATPLAVAAGLCPVAELAKPYPFLKVTQLLGPTCRQAYGAPPQQGGSEEQWIVLYGAVIR
jgi:hypothetical protein